jgi:hypothetical protein
VIHLAAGHAFHGFHFSGTTWFLLGIVVFSFFLHRKG